MTRSTIALSSPSFSTTTSLLIDNPPSPNRLIQALRDLGYDNYASILDILDNSIDAHATEIKVLAAEENGDITIAILDDGVGMDEETLSEALRMGSETDREAGDLGKFGMGLVTASIAIGQRVDILTREDGGPILCGGFDLEDIARENRFVKFIREATPQEASSFPFSHGTVVRISKTDRLKTRHVTTFVNTLKRRAGQVFRRFLKSNLSMEVNGSRVEPVDPLLLAHPQTSLLLETGIEIEGGIAYLRVVDLPDLGSAGNRAEDITADSSGFYILRNNREIMAAQTFGFYRKHPDFTHFRAELSFDGTLDSAFSTDVRKMSITPTQSLIDRLRQSTQSLITDSARRARGRANIERGQVDHSVAEANIARRTQLIPKPPTLVEVRSPRQKKTDRDNPEDAEGREGQRQRSPHVTTLKTVSGMNVVFEEGDYGEQGPFYLVRQEGRSIVVTYNREHPFWREFLDHADTPKVVAILDYIVFALANAELLVPEQATLVKANVNTTLLGLLV